MAPTRHTLLARQLRRHFDGLEALPSRLNAFVDSVDAAYREFDSDRSMLERSLDLSSQELLQSNLELRVVQNELEARVRERTAALSKANLELMTEFAERERFESELLWVATHDSLTDLANRRQLGDEIEAQLRRSEQESSEGALIYLDLDQFK